MIVEFADQTYQYQTNTGEYQDKSHATYYGRSGAPLTARKHLLGVATLSQALRLAATLTREGDRRRDAGRVARDCAQGDVEDHHPGG